MLRTTDEFLLTRKLPFPHRVYAWWIKNGLKRKNGLILGGNRLFAVVRQLYNWFPGGVDNFAAISAWNNRFTMAIDLLDFEVTQHTLDLAAGSDDESRLLQSLFPSGGTFLDIGANYGFYALMASYIGGPDSLVCAFEPQPRLAEAMRMSKKINQFPQLKIYELALGDKDGEIDFFIPDTGSGRGSLHRDHAGLTRPVNKTVVKIETLDSALIKANLQRLDVIKIDVEGAELDVIRGAEETIKRFHPYIWFEMNPGAQSIAGREQEEIYSLLESFGYKDFYDVADFMLGTPKAIRTVETLKNVLAVPDESKRQYVLEETERTLSI